MRTDRRGIRRVASVLLALVLMLAMALPALAQDHGQGGADGDGEQKIISEMGILLLFVEEGSPADTAGLQSGDIVLAVNGIRVENLRPIWRVLRNAEPGDVMTLVVKSGSEVKVVPLVVGRRPGGRAYFGVTPFPVFGQRSTVDEIVGLDQSSLGAVGEEQCTERMTWALLINGLVPGGPAEAAGLLPGDVVVAVNGNPIPGEEGIREALQSLSPGDTLMLEVYSQGAAPGASSHFVEFTVGARPGAPGVAYVGAEIGHLQYVVTDCGATGGSTTVEALPAPIPGDFRPEAPVDPSAVVPPPAGLENCTYEQTWGFGVTQILPDGPAEAAGLAANDAIVLINGAPIPAGVQAESLLAGYAPGDEVTLHVIKPFDIASGADVPGESDVTLTLASHPNVPDRAFLGIMGMPVIMGDSMSCSGTAPAEPVPAEPVPGEPAPAEPAPGELAPNDDGVHSSEKSIPQVAVKGEGAVITATITSADVTTPTESIEDDLAPSARAEAGPGSTPTEDGLWLWCPRIEGTYTCFWPAGIDAPIVIAAEGDVQAVPVAPPAITGGAILSGTQELPLIPGQGVPVYCWTGQGFTQCSMPQSPALPQPRTNEPNR